MKLNLREIVSLAVHLHLPLMTPTPHLLSVAKFFVPSVMLLGVALSCDPAKNAVFDQRPEQGKIVYQVSFPNIDETNMAYNILPEQITMFFKNDNYVTELDAMGGLFKTRFIAWQRDKVLQQELKIFKKKVSASLQQADVYAFLAEMPPLTIVPTQETDSIAGFLCKKAIGVFEDPTLPDVQIYYTEAIKLAEPNWCNQYHQLNGVLLAYDMEQFGIRMRLKATSVSPEDVPDIIFTTEPGYEEMSPEAIRIEMEELMASFEI